MSNYDLSYLRSLSAEPEFLSSMVRLFLNVVPLQADQLDHAIREQDAPLASQTLHQIKPSLQSFGFMDLVPETIELEQMLKAEVPMETLIPRLENMHKEILLCIESIRSIDPT